MIAAKKKQLREAVKENVAALPEAYRVEADAGIRSRILELEEYQKAGTIFCYIGRNIEIDTLPLIYQALAAGKTVGVPRCIGRGIMEVRSFTRLEDMKEAKFGILEPDESCKLILPSEIEFAILPCMSCTTDGRRLGFGGGFYDRYLEHADFFTCLICRQRLILTDIPVEPHDIVPDMVITEEVTARISK